MYYMHVFNITGDTMINAMEESLQKARSTIEELIVLKKAIKHANLGELERLTPIYRKKIEEFETIHSIYLRKWESVFTMVNSIDNLF